MWEWSVCGSVCCVCVCVCVCVGVVFHFKSINCSFIWLDAACLFKWWVGWRSVKFPSVLVDHWFFIITIIMNIKKNIKKIITTIIITIIITTIIVIIIIIIIIVITWVLFVESCLNIRLKALYNNFVSSCNERYIMLCSNTINNNKRQWVCAWRQFAALWAMGPMGTAPSKVFHYHYYNNLCDPPARNESHDYTRSFFRYSHVPKGHIYRFWLFNKISFSSLSERYTNCCTHKQCISVISKCLKQATLH